MKIKLAKSGSYVVAVSGGVDSVVLLHMLRGQPGCRLTVAHFDHGIRPDSRADRLFVRRLARSYGLPFVFAEGQLGATASEAAARRARYDFLHKVRRASGARAVVTAHHQDDVLETAIINLLRGTGRTGLANLRSTDTVKRPLLHVPKAELVAYARQHRLQWREDSTNSDDKYLRNYVRHRLLSRFQAEHRTQLHDLIKQSRRTNRQLDGLLINYLHAQPDIDHLHRHDFIMLPHNTAREVLAMWLRLHGIGDFNRRTLERLVHAAKIYAPGKQTNIGGGSWLKIHPMTIELVIE